MLAEPLAVTLLVVDVLEKLEIPYVLGGSMASAQHGVARSTLDSDIVADLNDNHIDPFVNTLQTLFYINRDAVRQAIVRHSSFNLIHLETMFKVDVFIPKARDFDREQIARGIRQTITESSERTICVATPEDTILAKLEWFRLGGEVSERQWRDIVGIISVQGVNLDRDYVTKHAAALDVLDLWQKVLSK